MRMAAVVIVAGALVFGVPGVSFAPYHTQSAPPAAAADVKTQLGTAVTHAGFAADGTSLGYVQQHLGHTLNCLEGTKGKNFNQSWGHVCQGQGNGILVDLKTASGGAAFMLVAESAGTLASNGLRSKDLTETKVAAKGVAALLKVIAENLK